MSPSARRLASSVATNRFAWQGEAPASVPAIVPVLRTTASSSSSSSSSSSVPVVAPALRDLPSPAAERLEAAEREAYARGLAEGQRAGEAAATARIDAISAQVGTAIQDLAAVRGSLMRRSERDLVRLAVSMAERVLRRAIDMDRELLVVMARVAIDRLGEHAAATIHLNPVDLDAILARHAPDLGKSVELTADASIPRGGCVVKASFGTIDMGIDSQMRELSRALLGDDEPVPEGVDRAPADV